LIKETNSHMVSLNLILLKKNIKSPIVYQFKHYTVS
jgi:hypothetical protein